MQTAAILLLLFASSAPAFAQNSASPLAAQSSSHPDLSGTWKLNLAKSKPGAYMKVGSETIEVTSTGSAIETRSTDGGKISTRSYVVDGFEHFQSETIASPNHFRTYCTSIWRGGRLINQYRMRMETSDAPAVGAPEGDRMTESWSLSPDRRVLTRRFTGKIPGTDQTLVYDKQPPLPSE